MELVEEVRAILEGGRYRYSEYSGCFDIIASRHGRFSPLLLKLLSNIDSLQFSQANNLKILSRNLDAQAMVIGSHTRRENLDNNVIYERFEISAITPKTLENMLLLNDMPVMYRFRGGMFTEIDNEKLADARRKKGLTQRELADKVGVTKKSIYEHERISMKIEHNVAKNIEARLGCALMRPVTVGGFSDVEKNSPKDGFERGVSKDLKNIGFSTEIVQQAPFNIIAREKFIVFSDAAAEQKRIERDVPYLEGFSKVVRKHVIAITRGEADLDVPTIEERDLRALSKPRDLERLIKKQ